MTTRLTPAQAQRALAKGKRQKPETLILNAVRKYLRAVGWYVVRHQKGLGCQKGIADLSCTRGGRTVWVEIKTATGAQSDDQRDFEREIITHGGEYHVLRSVEDAAVMSGEELLC